MAYRANLNILLITAAMLLGSCCATAFVYAIDMVPIPGGEFEMGDHQGEGWLDELPIHSVYIDSFYMSRYEITNQQYCNFLNSALTSGSIVLGFESIVYGNNRPYCKTYISSYYSPFIYNEGVFSVGSKDGRDMSDDPVVQVTWYGATAYCNWLSQQEGYQRNADDDPQDCP